jgi:hypothetical protein
VSILGVNGTTIVINTLNSQVLHQRSEPALVNSHFTSQISPAK